MPAQALAKGANTALTASRVRVELTWSPRSGSPDLDVAALLLSSGKVRTDADFVFYNQPDHASGAVRHVGKVTGAGPAGATTTDAVEVDLAAVEAGVDTVAIVASVDGGQFASFDVDSGAGAGVGVRVVDVADGAVLVTFDVSGEGSERAMIAGELYRRGAGWKVRAVGQGWDSGLAGLAQDMGISVDDVAPSAPAAAPPVPARVAPAPSAPPRVNLDKGRVSLRKNETVSLVKTGAPPLSFVIMGLGWDPVARGKDVDLDASVVVFEPRGKDIERVYFGNLAAFDHAIQHAGDNLTGEGDGDDEQIRVDLSRLPPQAAVLVFTITSYRGQRFEEVRNAYCRLLDGQSGAELVRFDLSESQRHTGVIMAAIYRTGPTWSMRAVGSFHDARTVRAMVDPARMILPTLTA